MTLVNRADYYNHNQAPLIIITGLVAKIKEAYKYQQVALTDQDHVA